MDMKIEDFEKLGAFYLGREYDLGGQKMLDDLILYDSKDLVTHGVVLGMTGSGKTGLCMALLEEAAIDQIPAIVIDPKGDIANFLLTFPDLAPGDFRPWVNEDDARRKGKSPDEYAAAQAGLWGKGLGQWGQDGERIRKLKETAGVTIYTPGSNAGIPVSILSSLKAPPFEVMDDSEVLGDRIESTVSSLLSLLGIDADPIRSREHILMSTILNYCWAKEEDLDLGLLIHYIQAPPFEKVGVMKLDSFYPESKRIDLSMQINNLLAAPGFSTWMSGVPLDMSQIMHDEAGRPQVAVFSIAHLGDAERMFFVSLLLNQTLAWMRTQPGTTSLRALLYMDEIYGYLPPTANPPSKKPMMTMLKQARAFGLGILLATQNPVDLDYKALSNIGTWFLGRLQTERDKARVLDGLEGAAVTQGGKFDRRRMEQTLAGLGARVFLLNNVHEDAPVTFHVRWVMSYLRGPLTRGQIKKLMDPEREAILKRMAGAGLDNETEDKKSKKEKDSAPPRLSKRIHQGFLPVAFPRAESELVYIPAILRSAEIGYHDTRRSISGSRTLTLLNKLHSFDEDIDWNKSVPWKGNPAKIPSEPASPAAFAHLPEEARESTLYTRLKKDYIDWIYQTQALTVFESDTFDALSRVGESEGEFRVRLQQQAREVRDRKISELRNKFTKKMRTVEDRVERAQLKVDKEKAQARDVQMRSAISIGGSILGSLFGRKSGRRSSATSGVSRAWKEGQDVKIAKAERDKYERDLAQLNEDLLMEIDTVKRRIDPMTEPLAEVKIPPKKKDIKIKEVSLAWLPYYRVSEFELEPAWQA